MVSNLRCRIKENTIPVQSNTKIVPGIDWDFLSHKKKNPKNRIIQNDQQIFL